MPKPSNCVGPDCNAPLKEDHKGPPFCSPECQAAKKVEGMKRAEQQKIAREKAAAEKEEAEVASRNQPCLACNAKNVCKSGVAHCNTCIPLYSSNLLVFCIKREGTITVSSFDSEFDSAEYVRDLISSLNLKPEVILDLHGVTDTVNPDTDIGNVAVLSYVGKHSTTRYDALADIKSRILSDQIQFGALVFKRGKRKGRKTCEPTQEPGSKAWFCSLIPTARLFIDDSSDHVESVTDLKNGPKAVLFDPKKADKLPLTAVINQHLS